MKRAGLNSLASSRLLGYFARMMSKANTIPRVMTARFWYRWYEPAA